MFVLKPLGFRKLSHSSEMRNDALMHRVGLCKIITLCMYTTAIKQLVIGSFLLTFCVLCYLNMKFNVQSAVNSSNPTP